MRDSWLRDLGYLGTLPHSGAEALASKILKIERLRLLFTGELFQHLHSLHNEQGVPNFSTFFFTVAVVPACPRPPHFLSFFSYHFYHCFTVSIFQTTAVCLGKGYD